MPTALLAATALNTWPFVVLVACVAFVIIAISVLRLHPFLALIFAAILAGVMAESLPLNPNAKRSEASGTQDMDFGRKVTGVAGGKLPQALKLTTIGFGETAGNIAIVIGMATIIGMALMESGAADKVVRRFLAVCGDGPKGISFAIVISTYILSIPIFFDSMFMLMVPIAMAMALRTGRDFTLYVLAICAGGTVTHSLTVPHPGPLFMVDNLKIDIGLSLWVGIVVGLVPVVVAWLAIQALNRWTPVNLRESANAPIKDLKRMMEKPESELPGLLASLAPIIVPIVLISITSVFEVAKRGYTPGAGGFSGSMVGMCGGLDGFMLAKGWVDFIGNKNMALILGAGLSLWLLARQRKFSFRKLEELMGPPLETGGVIILITSAGGAFGYMLAQAGVGDALGEWARQHSGINLILLAYAVALVFRIAQGSATVSMQTTSAMLAGLATSLPYHPIYVFLAIGFGAIGCSWMNDSGFWVVSRLSGFTEKETLRTWSVLLTVISLTGLVLALVLSNVLPLKGS
jgi:gluconate:H+ symporter, GntP family